MTLAAGARALVVGPGPVRPGLGPGASVVASDLASALAARGVEVVAVDSSPTSALLWTPGPKVRYVEPLDAATLRRIAEAERAHEVVAHAAGPIVLRALALDRRVGADLVDATREAQDASDGGLVDVVAASDGSDVEILAALSAASGAVALADSEHRVLGDVPPELAAAAKRHVAAEPVIGLVTLRCLTARGAWRVVGVDRIDPAAWPVAGLVRGVRPGALLAWLLLDDPLADAIEGAAAPRRVIEARVPCFDFDPYPGADRTLGSRAKSLGATLRAEPLAHPPPPAGRRVLIVGPGPMRAGHGAEASLAVLLGAREAARLGHEVVVITARDGTGAEAHAARVHVTSDYDAAIQAEAPSDVLLGFGADPSALAALAARSTDVGAGAVAFAFAAADRPTDDDAVEVHVVVLSDGAGAKILGTFEHVERAAVHPADAAAVSPSLRVDEADLRAAEERALELAPRLGIRGLYTAELGVRAGRGVALTNLTAGVTTHALSLGLSASVDVVAEALRLALGEPLGDASIPQPRHVAVEEHVFAFAALGASDTKLDRRPRSTGSVLGLGESVARAYAGALAAMGPHVLVGTEQSVSLRRHGPDGARAILLAGAEAHAVELADTGRRLYALGFDVVATEQAARWLERARVPHRRTSDAAELVARRGVVAAVSTGDDSAVRRAALVAGVVCFTTVDLVKVAVKALELDEGALATVTSLEARG